MDNQDAQRLAQMLQQQQMQKMMQGGAANGMQGAMGQAERMQPSYDNMLQMPQQAGTPMQSEIPVVSPQGSYAMPMTQPSYTGNMPTNPQMGRRNMLQGAVNSLGQQAAGQGMGQGAMTAQDAAMMRRMPK